MSYKIGIDISGGDFAPHESFKGAVLANKELAQKIVLIGIEEEIEREAEKEKIDLENFEVIDAPEKISMDEVGAMSIRRKRKSSIAIGLNLLKERKIDAFVSCGNTAAVVSAASLILGVIASSQTMGVATGPFVAGYIFDVRSSYQPAFLITVMVSFAGLMLSATLRPVKKHNS